MNEGGADYERGIWDPLDLMMVRDAAVADIVPKMSQMEGYGDFNNPRLVYNLGHALTSSSKRRWGKEGVRQFLFSLRKSAIGGGTSPYEEAFQMTAARVRPAVREISERSLQGVPRQGAAGRLRPGSVAGPGKDRTTRARYSIEPSPSGDLIAVATGNRHDQELDIVLISSKDG